MHHALTQNKLPSAGPSFEKELSLVTEEQTKKSKEKRNSNFASHSMYASTIDTKTIGTSHKLSNSNTTCALSPISVMDQNI